MFTALVLPLVLLAADDSRRLDDRPRHPLAPSLPTLTKQEEARIDAIIDRFIAADIGKTDPATLKKATTELNRLGPEAIFNLIEAFNRAANLEHSCPAVVLGKKISLILGGSQDVELLTFAKENIGLDVTGKRHLATVKDLQVGCMLRRTAVLRQQALAARAGPALFPATMAMPEMIKSAEKAKAPQLRLLLAEAEKRQSPELLKLLAAGAANPDPEAQKLGRDALARYLERQRPDQLKALLQHERPAVRAGAAGVVASRNLRFGGELIDLLDDPDTTVQQVARRALVRLSRGADYGPGPGADSTARAAAVAQWRQWWVSEGQR